jgi:hypothetical protein
MNRVRKQSASRRTGMVVDDAPLAGVPDAFHELPLQVYAGDANWIPERARHISSLLASPSGSVRVAVVPGKARAAGFCRPAARLDGRRACYFGLWETAGDGVYDRRVIGAIKDFARERGCEILVGPIDFSTHVRYRLRLSAEAEAAPIPGEPYNPPSYPSRLRALGFARRASYLTQIAEGDSLARTVETRRPVQRRLEREGYRFERLDADAWCGLQAQVVQLTQSIFGQNFAYTPPTDAEIATIYGAGLGARLHPCASGVAYGPRGDIAAIALAFPNYAPLLVQGASDLRVEQRDLSYADHAPLLRRLGETAVVLKTVGTAPEHRRRGLAEAITGWSVARACEHGARRVYGALIHERSPSRRLLGSCREARWYGLYATPLTEPRARETC